MPLGTGSPCFLLAFSITSSTQWESLLGQRSFLIGPTLSHSTLSQWAGLLCPRESQGAVSCQRQREDRCPVKPVPGKMSSSEVQDVGKDPSEELSHHIKTALHPCYHTASQRESDASVSATSRREVMTPKACPDNLTFLCLCHLSFRCSPCIHIRRGRNYSKP